MDENRYQQYSFDSDYANRGISLNQYISRTFAWMFLGLLDTFGLGWLLATSGVVYYLFAIPAVLMILLALELVVVLVLSCRIHKQSVNTSRLLFLVYALLNGLVFSVYFIAFEVGNLIAIFGLTALFFGAFALYGRFTKTDLSRLRPFLIAGLVFLVIAAVLSFFINMTMLERGICMAGIVIFLCFTAYDTQKIKANYEYYSQDPELLRKAGIYSALELYLDFINLFLYLLRFLGSHKK